jgi:hypothetical protein
LQKKKDRLDLDDTEIDKIYNNKVDGNTFLELTRDDLLSIEIALKPAKEIGKLISQIRGGKRTSFSCPHRVIFANNTEYLLILVLFFPAIYRQTRPKKHIHIYCRATQC